MSVTKDELRAEIAALREELAAERGKNEVLREEAGQHHCHGACAVGLYWCATCVGMRYPGHTCTYTITWTSPNYMTTPWSPGVGISTTMAGTHPADIMAC